jgi:site-specific recombinase XerD
MKVTAILKGRIDTNGQRPIQVRIFNNGKNYYRPTHIKVLPTQFKKGRVVEHPKAQEWNEKIKNLIIQYQAKALQEPEKKQPKTLLFDYITRCMNKWDKVKKTGTLRIYASQLEKLKGFTPNVLLTQIDNNFLYAYQSHLLKLGNSQNTVWSSFKFLRTILNDAVKNDLLDKSPFRKFTMPKYEDPNKTYLLPDELKRIDKFCQDKKCPPELFFVGTWFLIGCSTGMRLSDQKAFDKKKNVHNDRLVIKTAKTGELVGLPIDTALKKLFERVNYKPMHYTGEQYNRLLKLVIMGAGIDKKVSTHIGRHTFSMRLANSGVSQEVTAKILGHADLRSTASYYKITNFRVDNEMKKVKK